MSDFHIQSHMPLKREAGEHYIIKLFMQRLWSLTITPLSEASRGLHVSLPQRVRVKRAGGDSEAQAKRGRPEEGSVLHKLPGPSARNRELTQLRAPSREGRR